MYKRIFMLIFVAIIVKQLHAQSIPIANDQFHLYGPNSGWSEYLRIGGNGWLNGYSSVFTTNGNLHIDSKFGKATYLNRYTSSNIYLGIGGGNVGIGTENPASKLQVQKDGPAPAITIGGGHTGSPRLQIYGLSDDPNAWMGLGSDMGGSAYEHSIYFPTGPTGYTGRLSIGNYNGTTYNPRLMVLDNGNVGVGTNSPQEKLSVNGKIRAHEIKVETDNWPDYVFEKGYDVGTLEGLETYIKTHKHLPEIPSAKEAETNGIALGEMNKLLLKKIEELTLHLIKKDKQLTDQESRLKKIEKLLDKTTIKR